MRGKQKVLQQETYVCKNKSPPILPPLCGPDDATPRKSESSRTWTREDRPKTQSTRQAAPLRTADPHRTRQGHIARRQMPEVKRLRAEKRVPPLLQLLRPAATVKLLRPEADDDLKISMDANLHVDAHVELLGTSQLLRPSRLENMRNLPVHPHADPFSGSAGRHIRFPATGPATSWPPSSTQTSAKHSYQHPGYLGRVVRPTCGTFPWTSMQTCSAVQQVVTSAFHLRVEQRVGRHRARKPTQNTPTSIPVALVESFGRHAEPSRASPCGPILKLTHLSYKLPLSSASQTATLTYRVLLNLTRKTTLGACGYQEQVRGTCTHRKPPGPGHIKTM